MKLENLLNISSLNVAQNCKDAKKGKFISEDAGTKSRNNLYHRFVKCLLSKI